MSKKETPTWEAQSDEKKTVDSIIQSLPEDEQKIVQVWLGQISQQTNLLQQELDKYRWFETRVFANMKK